MFKKQTKAALLAQKKQLLEEIQYSQKSIDDLQAKLQIQTYYEPDSSDSEDYFPDAIDKGPDLQTLKRQHSMLKICQHAAQELTGVTVLQSEINVLVEEPQFEGEPPIKEPGTWREVTAECRIDLVPFTMTFLIHTGLNIFAPTSYRVLKTCLVKSSHEVELNNSVLQAMRTPSDAVEIIRSYAAAHRSRRTTLAHLANKYAHSLFMEPHPEGGFVLKCANLLEILWRLENKWSPLVPFHHRMKFDLEYMDESYVKIITQAHKELLDPSIQTDERTLLLAKIINTCLEVRGTMDSESDLDSVGVMNKKTENQKDSVNKDKEVMAPPKKLPKKSKMAVRDTSTSKNVLKRANEDINTEENSKKIKSTDASVKNVKTRENNVDTKINDKENNTNGNVKDNDVIKKKSNEKTDVKKSQTNNKANSKTKKDNIEIVSNDNNENINEENAKKRKLYEIIQTENINVDSQKQRNAKPKTMVENNDKAIKDINKNDKVIKNNKRHKTANGIGEDEINKNNNNVELSNDKDIDNNIAKKAKMTVTNDNSAKDKNKKDAIKINKDNNDKISNKNRSIEKDNNKNDLSSKPTDKNNTNDKENSKNDGTSKTIEKKAKITTDKNANKEKNKDLLVKKIDKKTKMSIANDKKFDVITKKVADIHNKNKNIKRNDENIANNEFELVKSVNIDKIITSTKTQHDTNLKTTKIVKNTVTGNTEPQTVKKNIEKNVKINNKLSSNKVHENKIVNSNKNMNTKTMEINKNILKINTKSVRDIIHKSPLHKNTLRLQNSHKTGNTKTQINTKIFSGNIVKENSEKNSKIPQKNITNENTFKNNNMLRISPRNLNSKFKSNNNMSKELMKKMMKNTNIPRLMKKPTQRSSK